MRCITSFSRAAVSAAWLVFSSLSPAAHAQAAADKPVVSAASAASVSEACERAARQSLAGRGLRPAEVTFAAAPAVQPSLSNESLTVLRGVARWKGDAGMVHSINYSCNVDPHTSEMVGLVMRDTTPAAEVAPAVASAAPVEPDFSRLSPEACESSAVEALKRRWPRVSQISFDISTRSFQQQSASQGELHGSGRAVPTPNMPSTFFAFDCQLDPRDGRVQRTNLSW